MKKILFLFLCVFVLNAEAQYVGRIDEVVSLPTNPIPTVRYVYQGNVYTFADGHWIIIDTQSNGTYAVSSFGGGGSPDSTIWMKKWREGLYTPLTDSRLTDARTPLTHAHLEGDISNLTTDLAGKQATIANLSDTSKYVEYSDSSSANGWYRRAMEDAKLNAKQNTIANLADTSKYVEYADTIAGIAKQWALAGKQATLVSGTNIKTVNSNSLLGSGDIVISGGGLPGYVAVKRTADTTNSVATPVNAGGMNFALVSGTYYRFRFCVMYSTGALTTGIKLTLTTPTFTTFSASVIVQGQAADAVGAAWHGTINASGDVVTSTNVAVINVNYVAIIEGVILPSANGTMWLQWSPEVAAAATLRRGTMGEIWSY